MRELDRDVMVWPTYRHAGARGRGFIPYLEPRLMNDAFSVSDAVDERTLTAS
ncbi:MAG: hypothetical protein GTO41_00195 [Burkholderiales bacterium]|nr:hypothetical protein [Burkholderiales bacterium]